MPKLKDVQRNKNRNFHFVLDSEKIRFYDVGTD